jgi:hypothetical protein
MKAVLGTPSTEGGNRIPSPRKDVKASATVPIEKALKTLNLRRNLKQYPYPKKVEGKFIF